MLEESLQLFGLHPGASLHDIKRSYRKLAKQNHPDRFTDPEQKREQEIRMARINNAYQVILSNLEWLSAEAEEANSDGNKLTDYTLYKKGIEYFNVYTGDYSHKERHILEFETEKLLEKKNILSKAKDCFQRILREYPESDWALDSEDRIRQIDRMINHIENRIDDINRYSPYWTEKGTPYSKRYENRKGSKP